MSITTGLKRNEQLGIFHVTTRKGASLKKDKMALGGMAADNRRTDSSVYMDSILTEDETNDVLSMMIMADEHNTERRLPSFCTSSQMGGRNQRQRPDSPPLSPLPCFHGWDVGRAEDKISENDGPTINASTPIELKEVSLNNRNKTVHGNEGGEIGDFAEIHHEREAKNSPVERNAVNDPDLSDVGDAVGDVKKDREEVVAMVSNDDTDHVTSPADKQDGGQLTPETDGDDSDEGDWEGKQNELAGMEKVNAMLKHLDERSDRLNTTVKELEHSLEFSQSEIDKLKKENSSLRRKLEEIATEDKRTQFQVNSEEGKLDRLETVTKRKNLIFEGIPEADGRREDAGETICNLFDQLSVDKGKGFIGFEACYRVGSFTKSRARPILVSFERQADRDLIYKKRMELRKTADYQKVWVNEDLGPISKRRRGLIRMIAKEAELQGIDCRTGKYSLHVNQVKYSEDNLDDLPPPLHPTQLKQILVDDKMIAYQSEYAPFSNFFPCKVVIGKHVFFCLEQAFQFTKAKTLHKSLAATKIYLSRDVRFIKQLGWELGTSDEWEARRFDVMYECLKRKFEQNQDLRELLLKTGDLELVEATPDILWGCGATLSSNVLRKRTWKGKNKHGEILMVVREELRMGM